jgi:hypothetical protein
MKKVHTRSVVIVAAIAFLMVVFPGGIPRAAEEAADTVSSLPGVEIETSVDRAEVYIGDLITYAVTISYDPSFELIPPPLGANLGAFDVKDYQPDIETELDDGRRRSQTIFTLSTFTTGDYVIPPVPVAFRLPDSTVRVMMAEPVPITVQSLLFDTDDSVDIRSARSPEVTLSVLEELVPDYTWWYVGGAGSLLLILGGLYFLWRRRRGREEAVDRRPPWEISFEELARLKIEGHLGRDEYYQYYFTLTEIARTYLGRMYLVDVLEMTTHEFLQRFRDIGLPGDCYRETGEFLNHADLVKFARMVPESDRAASDLDFVHDLVESVRVEFLRVKESQSNVEKEHAQPAGVTGGGV